MRGKNQREDRKDGDTQIEEDPEKNYQKTCKKNSWSKRPAGVEERKE